MFHDYGEVPQKNTLFTSNHSGNVYYAEIAILAKLYKKPFMIYAVGVGPLFTEEGKELTKLTFSLADIATVRDFESKHLVTSLGIDAENVVVTDDPAWILVPNIRDSKRILQNKGVDIEKNNILGVSVRNWEFGTDQNVWRDVLASVVDRFIKKYDVQVIFIPFDTCENVKETDFEVAVDVVSRMELGSKVLVLKVSSQ